MCTHTKFAVVRICIAFIRPSRSAFAKLIKKQAYPFSWWSSCIAHSVGYLLISRFENCGGSGRLCLCILNIERGIPLLALYGTKQKAIWILFPSAQLRPRFWKSSLTQSITSKKNSRDYQACQGNPHQASGTDRACAPAFRAAALPHETAREKSEPRAFI